MGNDNPQAPELTAEEIEAAAQAEAAAAEAAKVEADTAAKAKASTGKPKTRASRKRAEASGDDKGALHADAAEVLGIYDSEVLSVAEVGDDVVATTVDGQRYQLHGSARGEFTWLKQA